MSSRLLFQQKKILITDTVCHLINIVLYCIPLVLVQDNKNVTKIRYKLCCIFQEAFSLLAYTDPWSSPVGYLLDPVQREPICSSLNSAILGKRFICISD